MGDSVLQWDWWDTHKERLGEGANRLVSVSLAVQQSARHLAVDTCSDRQVLSQLSQHGRTHAHVTSREQSHTAAKTRVLKALVCRRLALTLCTLHAVVDRMTSRCLCHKVHFYNFFWAFKFQRQSHLSLTVSECLIFMNSFRLFNKWPTDLKNMSSEF